MTATRWEPTAAARRAVLVSALLIGGGVVIGRADLVVLAVPIAVATVVSLAGRPRGGGRPSATARVPALAEQGRDVLVRTTVNATSPAADVVSVLVPLRGALPHGRAISLAAGRTKRELSSRAVPAGWGKVVLARPDVLALAADGLLAAGPFTGPHASCIVLPGIDLLPPAAVPPRPAGLVGSHRTRRPGDGSDLLDVRAFQPGDRLRRIDWRVSARRGDLHVRRTAVDSDADVVLCIDPRVDLTRDGATWSTPTTLPAGAHDRDGSSLALTVRLAASLAAAHLRAGDRVALVDLVQPRRGVRSGSGRRQLLRIRYQLALTRAAPGAPVAVRPDALPTGSVVLVTSTFLDDAVADLAVHVRRRGALVLALDVLPVPVLLDDTMAWRAQAQKVILAERAVRMRSLAAAGVHVLPATDPVALPALMRDLLLRRPAASGAGRAR